MKSRIKRILSVFLLLVVLFCELAPVTASASSSVSKTVKLYGYGVSKTSIRINWTTQYDYDYYLIYRAQDQGSYKKITKVTGKNYTDKGLQTGSTYSYKVVGVDGKVKTTSNIKKVNPMYSVTPYAYTGDRNRIILEWSYPKSQLSAITGFIVYRKAESEDAYTRLGTLSQKGYLCVIDNTYYYNYYDTTTKTVGEKYYYKVVPYKGSRKGYSKTAEITMAPYLTLSTAKKEVTVKWTAYPKATAYKVYADIYKYDEDGYLTYCKTKEYATVKKGESRSYTISSSSTKKYMYVVYIEAYKTVKGQLEYLCTYPAVNSESAYSLMRNAASSKSNTTYKVVDVRGTEEKLSWTETLSSADKQTIEEFEKLHFQSGMSKTEKALYAFLWIHYNNVYDTDYTTSAKYSYVECIFNKKTGQCLQYNGALVEYLNYLGFEARIIQGYRGVSSNHFWGEVKIAGRWYCMETGNFQKDGAWNFFCERYGGYGATRYNICGNIT